ncbi:hypothetical protein [Desulfovibrio inopinatus]|uniref:hypothetical protein n=1 Tax=Desulfovibrio inopinatus TaxID=102109 RepID=UPI000422D271|nr:hypothetical protein [Desulfovibrio inopinatus]
MALTVTPVETKEELEAFIRFPWMIYKNDSNWVPPLIPQQREFLSKEKGPFFDIGDAKLFLAKQDGNIVGRISAHVNYAYDKLHDPRTGFFGFFESIDDTAVSRALFDTAAAWVAEKGKSKLHGPLNFSIYDEVGLQIEGFETMPVMFHVHNPAYYERLVLDWGFEKAFDWYAYLITRPDTYDADKMEAMLNKILERNNLTISNPKRNEFRLRAEEVRALFNDCWSKNWGHIPLTERQFDDIFVQLRKLLRTDLLNVILDGDELVAFSVVSPDMNPMVKKFNGRFGPIEILRLFWYCRVRPLTSARAIILGVKASHQWRRLHHALILKIWSNFLKNYPHIQSCDCSLIPESLTAWNKTLVQYGGQRNKTFRLYEREI